MNLIWALGLRSNDSDRTVPFRRAEIVKEPLAFLANQHAVHGGIELSLGDFYVLTPALSRK
jgi:hypothetical protein